MWSKPYAICDDCSLRRTVTDQYLSELFYNGYDLTCILTGHIYYKNINIINRESTCNLWNMDDDINILLVDDDVNWTRLMTQLLRRDRREFLVKPVTSVADAIDYLENETINCIVCDYELPGTNGLDFLELIREDHPDLPFLLITGRGSEETAAEAIAAGVTDYVVKDETLDQSAGLANRIANAVETYQIERALEDNQRRLTALFETIPDPVVLTTEADYTVQTVNPAFERVFGIPEEMLVDTPIAECLGTDDADESIENTPVETETMVSQEGRRLTADGSRIFMIRRYTVDTSDGETETCFVYTDITDRKEREQSLQRERDVKEAIRTILVSASTRPEVEQSFCDYIISSDEHEFAWIGSPSEPNLLEPSCWAGDHESYLEAISLSLEEEVANPEPAVAAMNSQELTVVGTISDAPTRGWQRDAHDQGFRSAFAAPLIYQDVMYGVLCVYSTSPNAFEEPSLRIFTELAEATAFAISTAERRRALFSDEQLTLEFSIEDEGYLPVALSRMDNFDAPEASLQCLGSIPGTDGTAVLYFSIAEVEPDEIVANLEQLESVQKVRVIERTERASQLTVTVTGPTISTILADHDALVQSINIDDERVSVRTSFSNRGNVHKIVDGITTVFPDAEVRSYYQSDRGVPSEDAVPSELTEKQRQALLTAYYGGYFERPRRRTSDQLAEELEISRSTFLQHLRVAERKLLDEYFESQRTIAR